MCMLNSLESNYGKRAWKKKHLNQVALWLEYTFQAGMETVIVTVLEVIRSRGPYCPGCIKASIGHALVLADWLCHQAISLVSSDALYRDTTSQVGTSKIFAFSACGTVGSIFIVQITWSVAVRYSSRWVRNSISPFESVTSYLRMMEPNFCILLWEQGSGNSVPQTSLLRGFRLD